MDLFLISLLVLVLLLLMWLWRDGAGHELELPDEELGEKIGEFRAAVLSDAASYIASRYEGLVNINEIEMNGYQTGYDNSILKMALPNNCIYTIEINWKTNKFTISSQFIPEEGEIKQYISTGVLKEGFVMDFTSLQKHCDEFNRIADIPSGLSDLSIEDLFTSIREAADTKELQDLNKDERLELLFDAALSMTEVLENEENKQDISIMDAYTRLLTYLSLEYRQDFQQYISQAIQDIGKGIKEDE